jgi:hypothetical protein
VTFTIYQNSEAGITVAHTEEMRTVYTPVRRSLEAPTCRWEGNIKRGLKEIGRENADWIKLA